MNTNKNTNTSIVQTEVSASMKVVHRSVSFGKKRSIDQHPSWSKRSSTEVYSENKTSEISGIKLISQYKKLEKNSRHKFSVPTSELMAHTRDELFLYNISRYIISNIACPDLNVSRIMGVAHMSRTQLHRKLKSLSGLSTTAFVRAIRLERAAYLLQQNVDNVTQIAYRTGFSDHSYFTKCFKRKYGVSPSDYIRNHKISYPF